MRINRTASLAAILLIGMTPCAVAQESKPTIRHHRVAETTPEDENAAAIDQAETAMQHNDFTAASALLQKVTAAQPDNYRAWFDLGYVYNATHHRTEAIDAYRKAVAAKPDVFESNLNLGLLLAERDESGQVNAAEAIKYLKAATQLKPTQHPQESLMDAWLVLGQVEEIQEPAQALLAFAEAEKLNPKAPEPHLLAAGLYTTPCRLPAAPCRLPIDATGEASRLNAAVKEYKTALDLDPKSGEALDGLAKLYEGQKNYPEAEIWLRKLVTLNPSFDGASLRLAKVLSAEGKNDEAAEQLKRALQATPGDPHAALELGTLYVKAGKDAEAEPQLRAAVQGLPQNAEAHYALGSLLLYEKKYAEAEQELLTTIRLKPDFGDAYGNLAIAAAANKDYGVTLQALDDRAKYLPDIPAMAFLRATTYDNLKNVPKAVEYYQQFLATDDGKFPDQEWQARHRLIALDPKHADKYRVKVKN